MRGCRLMCVLYGAGRSRGAGRSTLGRVLPRSCKLVLQPSYQAHRLRKSCREHTRRQNKPEIVNSVVALQDRCSYEAPPTTKSTSETFVKEKNKVSFCQLLRRCGSGDEYDLWYISVTIFCLFCVVEHHVSKMTFHHIISKKNCFTFQPIFTQFCGILAGQRAQRPTSLPPVKASAISSAVCFDVTS